MVARPPEETAFHGRFIPVTLALMAGIAGAAYLAIPPLLTALVVGGAAIVSLLLLPRPALALLLLLPVFLGAGYSLARPHFSPPPAPNHLANLLLVLTESHGPPESHDVVLTGVLRQLPRFSGERTRLVLAATELRTPSGIQSTHGLVQITVNGPLPENIRPGDRLLIRALVGPVRSFRVPGAFDYQRFLAHQGIRLGGWAASPIQVHKIEQEQQPPLTSRLRQLPERMRFGADRLLEQQLGGHPTLPLLKALLIGDRSAIHPATLETFKAGGAMHLLAISGMHLGMIALMTVAAAEWLLKRSPRLLLTIHLRKAALVLALPPIIAYAMITGLQPPALRALIMTLVFMAAILLNRQWCSLNNLALAALLILIIDPPALMGASFQLSFAATAGIILLVPALQLRYRQLQGADGEGAGVGQAIIFWIATSLLVSTVATLVTAPFSLHHFHRLSLLSPLTTLLATPPLFFWTLPLALLGLALTALNLPGGGQLLELSTRGIELTTTITARLADLPFSFYYLAPPSPAEWGAWLGLFGALLFIRRHPLWVGLAALLMLTMLLLLPTNAQWQREREQTSRVTFIQVGHGNATVIELPGNRTILVDGGGPSTLSTDIGEQLIAPFLRHRRIRRLEAVVISHPHADHYNGIPFLLRNFRPRTLWVGGHGTEVADYLALLELAESLGIEIRIPAVGEELAVGADRVGLHNLADFHSREGNSFNPPLDDPVNDQGLVIRYRHGDFSFLLPGDISMGQELRLLAQLGEEANHSVLAASHHGRWTSMAPEFVTAVAPRYIVVSDDDRRTDFARTATWEARGTKVLTTGRDGTITCTVAPQGLVCGPALRRR